MVRQCTLKHCGYRVCVKIVNCKNVMSLFHRVAWENANHKPIPEGMSVCRTGDNPKCVNPEHLWICTHAENMADRKAKGRCADMRGVKNPRAVLNPKMISICKSFKERNGWGSTRFLSRWFGVNEVTLSNAIIGNHWKE